MLSEAQQANAPLLETMFSLIIYGSLILFALVGGAMLRINPFRLGAKPAKRALVGLVFGAFGVVVATVYANINGTLIEGAELPADAMVLAWGAGIILLQTASEEIYFRGWLQPALAARWGPQAAVVVAALAFAALHVMGGARSPTTLINMFLGGLLFGYLAAYGRGIAGAIGAHFAWNATEQLLLGLDPNPGLGSFGALTQPRFGRIHRLGRIERGAQRQHCHDLCAAGSGGAAADHGPEPQAGGSRRGVEFGRSFVSLKRRRAR